MSARTTPRRRGRTGARRGLRTALGTALGTGLLLGGLLGCSTEEPGGSGTGTDPSADASAPAALPHATPSLAGGFELRAAWDPDPVPLNAEFELRFRLFDADGAPLEVAAEDLRVDADMPEHLHGMTVRPGLRREGDTWVASPLLFHMPGAWEIYVDLREGALTERALLSLEVR